MVFDWIKESWWIVLFVFFVLFIFYGRRLEFFVELYKKIKLKRKYVDFKKRTEKKKYDYKKYEEDILGVKVNLGNLSEDIIKINKRILNGEIVKVGYLHLYIIANIYKSFILKSDSNSYHIPKNKILYEIDLDLKNLNRLVNEIKNDPHIKKREVELGFMLHHIRNNTFVKKKDMPENEMSVVLLNEDYILGTLDVLQNKNINNYIPMIETNDGVLIDENNVQEEIIEGVKKDLTSNASKPKSEDDNNPITKLLDSAKKVTYNNDGTATIVMPNGESHIVPYNQDSINNQKVLEKIEESNPDLKLDDVTHGDNDALFDAAISKSLNSTRKEKSAERKEASINHTNKKNIDNKVVLKNPDTDSNETNEGNKSVEYFMNRDSEFYKNFVTRFFEKDNNVIYFCEVRNNYFLSLTHLCKFLSLKDIDVELLTKKLFTNFGTFSQESLIEIIESINIGVSFIDSKNIFRGKFINKRNGKEEVYTFVTLFYGDWIIPYEENIEVGKMEIRNNLKGSVKIYVEQFKDLNG